MEKMKGVYVGRMEEMEHWSKTSSVEPLPVGRHKKRPEKDSDCGFRSNEDYYHPKNSPRNVTVYSVSRAPAGLWKKENDRTSYTSYRSRGEVESPKFIGKVISDLPKAGVNVENGKRRCFSNNPYPFSENIDDSTAGQSTQSQEKWRLARKRVEKTLRYFREVCDNLLEADQRKRVDLPAAKLVKRKFGYPMNPFLGTVPGVEIGDQFKYRMELHVLGVHRPSQAGIDSMVYQGSKIAISVVDSGGYDNYRRNQETLIYCGHGGNEQHGSLAEDQKLVMGNLAMKNSAIAKNPVRVIRAMRVSKSQVFFYDGLYTVENMWRSKNSGGNLIFKFELVRMPGQPSPIPPRRVH